VDSWSAEQRAGWLGKGVGEGIYSVLCAGQEAGKSEAEKMWQWGCGTDSVEKTTAGGEIRGGDGRRGSGETVEVRLSYREAEPGSRQVGDHCSAVRAGIQKGKAKRQSDRRPIDLYSQISLS
jgi:hypothetical protein